jgi:hypothetical protein
MRKSVITMLLIVMVVIPATAALVTTAGADGTATTAVAARDTFRGILGGGIVPGAAGSFGGVRREINWDAVPDAFSAPNSLPANFFNSNSPRGAVFATPGSAVQVSANAGAAPVEFETIDPSYSGTFGVFTPQKLFTPIGSNVVDVVFFAAGTSTPASVSGFGAIFTDVDLTNTTSIEYFDLNNNSLGVFFVPSAPGDGLFSFLGVSGDAGEKIGRVRITNGNVALGAGVLDQNGATNDLVVMDDFLYSEPSAVPEPTTLMLSGLGIALLGVLRERPR